MTLDDLGLGFGVHFVSKDTQYIGIQKGMLGCQKKRETWEGILRNGKLTTVVSTTFERMSGGNEHHML